MEGKKTTVQNISKNIESSLEMAKIYLSIIFIINNIHITKRKLQLLSYISIYGINSVTSRENFCKQYKSSKATIGNMISELYEDNILIKEQGKIKLNPVLSPNFENNFLLNINLNISDAHR